MSNNKMYKKQLIYTSKITKNNTTPNEFDQPIILPSCPDEIEKNKHSLLSTCYPTCRPLKIYRKQGITSSMPTSMSSKDGCISDCSTAKEVGLPLKLLGKKENGETKMCKENTQGPVDTNNVSNTCRHMKGNIMSFSGNAKLSSSVQPTLYNINNNTTPYYTDYLSYIRGRGNTYMAKLNKKNIPNTDYTNPFNSAYYETTQGLTCNPFIKTIYKPNNQTFACQGAVTSSTRIESLKLNTIQTNNASFMNPFKTKIFYSPDPIFFSKNNVNKCYNITANTPPKQAALFAIPGLKC